MKILTLKNHCMIAVLSFLLIFIVGCKNENNMKNHASLKIVSKQSLVYQLPEPRTESDFSVEKAFANRRSHRHYVDKAIDASDVSQMLWAAYGVTHPANLSQLRGGLRTAPSAGALYPLEIYLLVGKVKDIEPGVYRYVADSHQIAQTIDHDVKAELMAAALNQEMIRDAPACLFYSAIYERTTEKYGHRGKERYVCMDLGHSAQNVYLQAEALHMGTCAIGAFNDEKVREVMQLPEREIPLYIMPFGYYYNKPEF